MGDRRSDQEQQPGADAPGKPSADIIPFRRPSKPVPKPRGGGGTVIGPRSRVAHRLRVAESIAYGFLFGLVALLLEDPVSALPFILLGLAIASGCWFSIAPRRGPIDNGTVVVTGLATALAGWLAYALVKSVLAGAGAMAIFDAFAGGMAYAMVVGWPAAIAAGLATRKLAEKWRPQSLGRR